MKSFRAAGFFLLLATVFHTVAAEGLRVADATNGGDDAIRQLALRAFLEHPESPVSIHRCSEEQALEQWKSGKADWVLLERRGNRSDVPAGARPYAAGALIVYVNTNQLLGNLSRTQAAELLTADMPTWKEFTAQNNTIHRLRLRPDKPAGHLPELFLLEPGKMSSAKMFKVGTVGEMLLLIQANPDALGFGCQVQELPLTVKGVAIDGVEPTQDNLKSGKYPLSFRRYLLSKKKSALEQQLESADFTDMLYQKDLIPLL